jgi:hypothetical protein
LSLTSLQVPATGLGEAVSAGSSSCAYFVIFK